jgi:hypothetical protein
MCEKYSEVKVWEDSLFFSICHSLIQTLQKVVVIFNQYHNFISDPWNVLIVTLVIPAYIDSACLIRFCKYKQYIDMHSRTDV